MREIKFSENNIYTISTPVQDLTYRLSHYGETNNYLKIKSNIVSLNGVFSVDVLLLVSLDIICDKLGLVLT